ncbi:MAG: TonB-dependent receptor [Candidatus Atribacteria bacterium]|nr:TonB-dependent receptor [Candidatus Atribacteria bacterium]
MSNIFLRFLIIFSIVIFNSINSFASETGKVAGTVIDAESSKAVPYANVELLKRSDSTMIKAVITNIDGEFLIEAVPCGNYLLRISCLGYRKVILPVFEILPQKTQIKLSDTKLITESKSLNEVIVTGYKLAGVIKDDKIIYSVNSKSAEIAQSGLELLRQLPDITVNYFSDDVKLAGSSNILFQVNGRKVDNNYLMQLNPGLVDKIEVINNPGANFDGAVDAVINIVLKREFEYGMGGQLRLQLPTSKDIILSKNNASVDIYFRKVRFYVAGRYKLHDYTIENLNKRTTSSGVYLNQQILGEEKGSNFSANYGFDWFINDKNTLSAYSSIQPIITNSANFTTKNAYTESETTYSTGFTSKTDKNYLFDYSIFFQHKFPKKEHQISFENYLSNRTDDGKSNYYEQNDLTIPSYLLIQNQSTESNNTFSYMKIDYTYPFLNKLLFSSGYNWYYLRKDYTYNDLVSAYRDFTNYEENRHSVYFNLSSNLGKLNIQTGIRYEFSNIKIIHVYDTVNRYNYFLPSIKANYRIDEKNILRFSYRKSLGRPAINQLSPANYTDDSYTQSKGNPTLKPSIKNHIELEHRIQFNKSMYVNYRPYLSLSKDGISQVNLIVSDSILRKQYSNVNNELEYGIIFSGMFSVKDIWTTNLSFTYYRKKLDALPEYGINETVKDNSWRLNISSQLVLTKEWMLFLEFNYEAPTIAYQSKKHEYYDFVIGFNKTFNKKFTVSAFTMNPWSNRYTYDKRTYSTESMVQYTENSIKYDYIFIIKFGYRFKSGKTGKKIGRNAENEEVMSPKKGILD